MELSSAGSNLGSVMDSLLRMALVFNEHLFAHKLSNPMEVRQLVPLRLNMQIMRKRQEKTYMISEDHILIQEINQTINNEL